MKIDNIINEAEVTSLSQFRQDRDEAQRQHINDQLHQARMEFLDQITTATAAAIDELEAKGMSRQGAKNLVFDHLDNLQSTFKDM